MVLKINIQSGDRDGDDGKGSLHVRKVQFFLTLFKNPLTPPPLSFFNIW